MHASTDGYNANTFPVGLLRYRALLGGLNLLVTRFAEKNQARPCAHTALDSCNGTIQKTSASSKQIGKPVFVFGTLVLLASFCIDAGEEPR